MIELRKIDNVFCRVLCDDSIAEELYHEFTFIIPNAKFNPLVKAKRWDGKIRLFNKKERKIYSGLEFKIREFANKFGYDVISDIKTKTDVTPQEIVEYCKSLNVTSKGETINHINYQCAAIYYALKNKRKVIISPTGSGKSLIIYSLVRWILENTEKKILIVVPNISLTLQLFSDFIDYSSLNNFNVDDNCYIIEAGKNKDSKQKVYITTYQSIMKLEPDWFHQFQSVIVDECHYAKTKSFLHILENAKNAEYRIGLSGSLDKSETNELVIQGLLGSIKRVADTSDLMDRGILAKLNIDFYELMYDKTLKRGLNLPEYKDEIDFVISYNPRNEFIRDLSLSLNNNVLILFNYVKKHGDVLYDMISEQNKDKNIYYITGLTEKEEREKIRNLVENSSNNIIIASFGVYSTGVNIKNLHHIVLASSTKSIVRLLQSIGRGLRIKEGKTECTFHDLCDNLVKNKKQNILLKHGIERIQIYNEQKFEYKIQKFELKEKRNPILIS